MRWTALTVVIVVLAFSGCSEVKKEIDTPGPAPPYDPEGARLDPNLIEHKKPAFSPAEKSADAPSAESK